MKETSDTDALLPKVLAYKLEESDTAIDLRYENLKGHDQQVVKHLKEACLETGSHLYLAFLERAVSGMCMDYDDDDYYDRYDCRPHYTDPDEMHEITEETDVTFKLIRVLDLSGNVVGNDIEMGLEDEFIIQKDAFEGEDPVEEDYEYGEGHCTQYYRTAVSAQHLGELRRSGLAYDY